MIDAADHKIRWIHFQEMMQGERGTIRRRPLDGPGIGIDLPSGDGSEERHGMRLATPFFTGSDHENFMPLLTQMMREGQYTEGFIAIIITK
jgi:hypothetical protein